MNESFSDELISAYLDGELTPDEQAAVEQALVESADSRQVFEELRALRGDLQAQPRYGLPADFSERVIRRAEQAMLREAESFVTAAGKRPIEPVSLANADVPAPLVELPSRPMQWSGIAWAAAALAAALLVALYLPGIESGSVAIKGDRLAETRHMRPDTITQGNFPAPSPEIPGGVQDDLPGPSSLANEAAKKGSAPESLGAPGEASGKPALPEPAFPKESVALRNADVVDSKNLKKTPESPAGPAAVAPAPAAPPGLSKAADALIEKSPAKPAEGRGPTPLPEGVARDKEGAESPLFVVRLPATRAALESGAFDDVLRKHRIRLDDAGDETTPAAETTEKSRRKVTEQVLAEGVDVLYVEASVAQIDGVLADLQAQPDRFLGVAGQRLADDEAAAATFQDGKATRERLAQRDRRSNGVELDKSFRQFAPDTEAGKSETPAAKLTGPSESKPNERKPTENKPGEPKAGAFGGGVAGGAPARGIAPSAPGAGAPGPARPSADFRAEAKKSAAATSRGAGAKAKEQEEAQLDGIASRIPDGPFKKYARFEPRFAENELSREGDAAGKRTISSLNLMKLADAYEAGGEGKKEAASHARSFKQDRAELQGLLSKDQADGAKQLHERLDRLSGGAERIRVLFVIRAVEQEPTVPPAK